MKKNSTHFYFLVRSWNAWPYLQRCLESILTQSVSNYTILFVDDCSDYPKSQLQTIKSLLKGHTAIFNQEQKFSVRNGYELIHDYIDDDEAIVVNVDGDDWLASPDVLKIVGDTYQNDRCLLTYGNCYYHQPGSRFHNQVATNIHPNANTRYPLEVEREARYRMSHFRPLHLRTWKAGLYKKIKKTSFLRPNGEWMRCCEDQAMFFPMLEMANGAYSVIQQPLYVYNRENTFNDDKQNPRDRLVDEVLIKKQLPYQSLR